MDQGSFWERRQYQDKAADRASTFEAVYPRHEFAELVRLVLTAGAWLANQRHRFERRPPEIPGSPLPGEMNPAE